MFKLTESEYKHGCYFPDSRFNSWRRTPWTFQFHRPPCLYNGGKITKRSFCSLLTSFRMCNPRLRNIFAPSPWSNHVGLMASIAVSNRPPFLLERIFGASNILSLHDYLIDLSQCSSEASSLTESLVFRHDHPTYSHLLLRQTFCIKCSNDTPLRQGFTLQSFQPQKSVSMQLLRAVKVFNHPLPLWTRSFSTVQLKRSCSPKTIPRMFFVTVIERNGLFQVVTLYLVYILWKSFMKIQQQLIWKIQCGACCTLG